MPTPSQVEFKKGSNRLLLTYDNREFAYDAEYLRVYSPSAEVRGHGPGQEILQTGKRHVRLTHIEPIGHYALRIHFSDGHNTGIYTWDYLYELGEKKERLWQAYLDQLRDSGLTRDPAEQVVRIISPDNEKQ